MKRMIITVLVLLLFLNASAFSEEEWSYYQLDCFSVPLPSDWNTCYNSSISILSSKAYSNGRYSDILTAVLMSLGEPILDESMYNALYNLILPNLDIYDINGENIMINNEPAYLWSGMKSGNTVAGIVYCHGDIALIIIHMNVDLPLDERLDFMRQLSDQITTNGT